VELGFSDVFQNLLAGQLPSAVKAKMKQPHIPHRTPFLFSQVLQMDLQRSRSAFALTMRHSDI